MKKLGYEFYNRTDVVEITRELMGKVLITNFNDELTSGRIIEAEAYEGVVDRASHAYNGRRTARTEVMFGEPGRGYIYLCYGIHHMFNVVTNTTGVPHAILIRAVEPVAGIDIMRRRTGKSAESDYTLTSGPGNVCKALGIYTRDSGISLLSHRIYIADDGFRFKPKDILATPRIGVKYAGDDASLLYRFIVKENRYVSAKRS